MTDDEVQEIIKIKKEIDELGDDINKLYDIRPPCFTPSEKRVFGFPMRIRRKKNELELKYLDISMLITQEDIDALIQLRSNRQNALKSKLENM